MTITESRSLLMARSVELIDRIKNATPGAALESWLNSTFPLGSSLYDDLARSVVAGVDEGWAANVQVDGPDYRRSVIEPPSAATSFFSITAVLMKSAVPYRGAYHLHPYGEVNLIAPLDGEAQLAGPNGWQGAGWTAPSPGSHHYPEVRNGALIALFYLPAGRISYDICPLNGGATSVPDTVPASLKSLPGTIL